MLMGELIFSKILYLQCGELIYHVFHNFKINLLDQLVKLTNGKKFNSKERKSEK